MQAALRSGPGRWLRYSPVLDWRRLLERTNRLSPQAPTVTFRLAEAPGQALWPPPPALVQLQAALPASQPPARGIGRQVQLSTADPSETETLVSVQAAPARQKGPAPAPAAFGLAALAGGKPIAAPAAVQAWRISAHYDAASGSAAEPQREQEQELQLPSLPVLPSIRTRRPPDEPLRSSDAAALYAGSPTKASASPAGRLGGGRFSTSMSICDAAAAAVPSESLERRQVSMAAELDDPLASTAASLQFIAFEAEPVQGGCSCSCSGSQAAQQPLPQRLHFTYRSLTGPAVTAPLRLDPAAGGQSSPGPHGRQLFGLVPDASSPSSGAGEGGHVAAAPVHTLKLLDAASLVQLMSSEGLPPAAAVSLERQHRLRAARWLAEGRLQVDVWDSASLLQVGLGSGAWLCPGRAASAQSACPLVCWSCIHIHMPRHDKK